MPRLFDLFPVTIYDIINAFFLYSFLGWVMECIVIRREKGAWENRGFARAPFCIIYGFGAMIGYWILQRFSGNLVVLFLVGAVLATLFEYATAQLMLRLFGTFWWDYTNKPFNYKGILCLESTLGWGVVAILVVHVLHRVVFSATMMVPRVLAPSLAFLLVSWYAIDFALCMRRALRARGEQEAAVVIEK